MVLSGLILIYLYFILGSNIIMVVEDDLSLAWRTCIENVYLAVDECKETNTYIPDYNFLADSLGPLHQMLQNPCPHARRAPTVST